MSFGETITRLRPGADTGEIDEQGNPVSGPDVETVSDGWAVEPVAAAESSEPYAQQVVVGYRLYKRGAIEDFRPTDRVIVRGSEWAVSGQLGDWENPYSKWRGTVVNVKAVG